MFGGEHVSEVGVTSEVLGREVEFYLAAETGVEGGVMVWLLLLLLLLGGHAAIHGRVGRSCCGCSFCLLSG